MTSPRWITWLVWALYVAAFAVVARVPRSDFFLLLAPVGVAFALWIFPYRHRHGLAPVWIAAAFVLGRLPFFFELPLLSDDFYRFLWDGTLINSGLNPFGAVPIDTIHALHPSVDPDYAHLLLHHMNSPRYPSVYPTLHQVVFAFGARVGGTDLLAGVNAMRAVFVAVEVAAAVFLYRRSRRAFIPFALYLLNPLTVIEGVGNAHFEALLVPLFAWLLWAVRADRPVGSAASWAAAVLVKLHPLILAPVWLFRWRGRRRWLFFGVAGALVIGGLALLQPWQGVAAFQGGVSLYFHTFEFNASLYYAVREVVAFFVGYNPIAWLGPLLGVIGGLALVVWAVLGRRIPTATAALGVYVLYLLFATTVHPWYVLPVIYLALAARRPLIAVWSLTVFLSYAHYLPPVGPAFIALFIEYGLLVAAIIVEHKRMPWLSERVA